MVGTAFIAAALAHLGQLDEARRQLAIFRQTRPDWSLTTWSPKLQVLPEAMPPLLLDGLRKAGLPE